jgi:phosphomannomutase/phosphoglucomutase
MMLCKDILSSNKGKIIFDVKCTDSLPKLIKDNGGTPLMYPTGHFNIKNGINEHNPLLAGEMSGHIFFNDKWYGFDDGVYSGARIIELILKTKKSISSLNKELPVLYSTPELNVEVSDKKKFEIVKQFIANCSIEGEKIAIDGLRINFDDGWGLLRASNTTPMLVMRFEGDSKESLIKIKDKFINELSRIYPDIDINLN